MKKNDGLMMHLINLQFTVVKQNVYKEAKYSFDIIDNIYSVLIKSKS